MHLTRLEFAQHPCPPQRELRQRGVFDSEGSLIGQVTNVYVDDDGRFRFVEVAMGELHAAPEDGLQRAAGEAADKNRGGGVWE